METAGARSNLKIRTAISLGELRQLIHEIVKDEITKAGSPVSGRELIAKEPHRLMGATQMAKALGVSVATIRNRITKHNVIPARKSGNFVLYRLGDVYPEEVL